MIRPVSSQIGTTAMSTVWDRFIPSGLVITWSTTLMSLVATLIVSQSAALISSRAALMRPSAEPPPRRTCLPSRSWTTSQNDSP